MAGRPPTKPAPTFGANLAALRKARGFSQAQLAEKLGVSGHMLAYYERKATNPSAEFVATAAQVLDVTTDELLGHAVKARKPGPPSQLEQLTARLAKLPRAQQKMVAQMLEGFLKQAS